MLNHIKFYVSTAQEMKSPREKLIAKKDLLSHIHNYTTVKRGKMYIRVLKKGILDYDKVPPSCLYIF